MQKSALYGLIAAGGILAASAGNALLPRIHLVRFRALPVAGMPRRVAEWENEKDTPIPDNVKKTLPEANMVTRVYRDPLGHTLELLLESSPNEGEYHLPTYCMPAQGWNVAETLAVKIGTIDATEVHIESGTERAVMLYWYLADPKALQQNDPLARFASDTAPTRLFARVTVPVMLEYGHASKLAHNFAEAVVPAVQKLDADSDGIAPKTALRSLVNSNTRPMMP